MAPRFGRFLNAGNGSMGRVRARNGSLWTLCQARCSRVPRDLLNRQNNVLSGSGCSIRLCCNLSRYHGRFKKSFLFTVLWANRGILFSESGVRVDCGPVQTFSGFLSCSELESYRQFQYLKRCAWQCVTSPRHKQRC